MKTAYKIIENSEFLEIRDYSEEDFFLFLEHEKEFYKQGLLMSSFKWYGHPFYRLIISKTKGFDESFSTYFSFN